VRGRIRNEQRRKKTREIFNHKNYTFFCKKNVFIVRQTALVDEAACHALFGMKPDRYIPLGIAEPAYNGKLHYLSICHSKAGFPLGTTHVQHKHGFS
jgi:hypothetical protein